MFRAEFLGYITALMSAFGRAYHTQNAENPIFPDTKVRELMTDEEYSMIAGYILSGIDFFAPDKKDSFANNEEILKYLVNPQIAPTPLASAAFCEDALKASAFVQWRSETSMRHCADID